jgi:N-acetyl-anhydromuramyl-L-alanine amidase AmpD
MAIEPLIRPSARPLADALPYIDAKHYRRAPRRSAPLWIVVHATHGVEGIGKARQGARELAELPPLDKRSTHVLVDTREIVQCVPWDCEAYHAKSMGNRYGEGIELCGRADQTTAEWLDAASMPMLELAAGLVRWRCDVRRIPLEWLTAADLCEMKSGITSHAEVSRAFRESRHWDPGPSFPITGFLGAVRLAEPAQS